MPSASKCRRQDISRDADSEIALDQEQLGRRLVEGQILFRLGRFFDLEGNRTRIESPKFVHHRLQMDLSGIKFV